MHMTASETVSESEFNIIPLPFFWKAASYLFFALKLLMIEFHKCHIYLDLNFYWDQIWPIGL